MARFLVALILIASVLALATTSAYGVAAPNVEYRVTYTAKNTPGGHLWQTQLGEAYSKDRMAAATKTVLQFLGITDVAQQTWNVKHVFLYIDDLPDNDGAAITTHFGNSLCHINFNANFLQKEVNKGRDLKRVFYGILVHEMTHVWQWFGDGQSEGRSRDVVEGIADYVRLKAGYASPDWVNNGGGGPWYNQYDGATPRFFNYIVDHVNSKFIVKLNQMMENPFKEDFFRKITGKTVSELWSQYKRYYRQDLRK